MVNDTDEVHVGGKIMVPKDVHILILGPVKCYLHGKRDLAGVIQLRILRWTDYSGLSGGPNVIVCPYKTETEELE